MKDTAQFQDVRQVYGTLYKSDGVANLRADEAAKNAAPHAQSTAKGEPEDGTTNFRVTTETKRAAPHGPVPVTAAKSNSAVQSFTPDTV